MKRSFLLFALLSSTLFAGTLSAQELPLPGSASPPPAVVAPNPAPAAAPASVGETWRFKWHAGRWWYWLPTERWVYWHGDHWEEYLAPPPVPGAVYPSSGATYY